MKWFEENRALGTFLVIFGGATLLCLILLWYARGRFENARAEFDQQAGEMAALQRHNPFPSEENLAKMKTQAAEYASGLAAFREELKTHVLPVPAELKPNEFQARLRDAMKNVGEKARANKVQLPENFFLGFEEFGAALPDTEAAPVLGQQLAQVELLVNLLLDARVQAITSLQRVPAKAEASASPSPKPGGRAATAAAKPLLERPAMEVVFTGPPGAVRRALNQIAGAEQQLFVIRTLHILNEKETGPPREANGAVPAPPPAATPAPASALNFIVGNEVIHAAARIELVRMSE